MSIQSVLLPVVVQIGLIFTLFGMMAAARVRAFRGGVDPQSVALSAESLPVVARQYANAFSNQFEFPVLFLFAVVFAIVLHQAGWLFVLLEWLFVAGRLGQASVAVTSNVVTLRGKLFFVSVVACALMWLLIFVGVFFGAVVS